MLLLHIPEDYKKTSSATEVGKAEVKGNFKKHLRSGFHNWHPTRPITESNNSPMDSDVDWPVFRRKVENVKVREIKASAFRSCV